MIVYLLTKITLMSTDDSNYITTYSFNFVFIEYDLDLKLI